MAEFSHIKGDIPALKPTTVRHRTEPPNVTIDQMMENLNEYQDKRLGIRKCYYNSGTRNFADIKKAYGKTQHFRANLRRDGWSVIVGKQIRQHLHKCKTDKLQLKKDKERLLNENNRLMTLLSKQQGSNNRSERHIRPITPSSKNQQGSLYPFKELRKVENQQHHYLMGESDDYSTGSHVISEQESFTFAHVSRDNSNARLAPVIVKNRQTEIEMDIEEEYEENGKRQTHIVKKNGQEIFWQMLQSLQKIYTLHPLVEAMIFNVNLRDNDQKRLTGNVEARIGESQENIEAGWEAVNAFLFELKPAEFNWSKITPCIQKTGESVVDYEEGFRQTWLEHAGLNHSEDLDRDTSMPLKIAFVNGHKSS
ncbi:hypothetical protein Q7C36_006672 [Tachysurus vachellii]|uniref:Uncharacterized protein n=1 Tax=Tachysurus vachellii TaxID=175792 RepID=A0AA88NAP5_TACVA|nr:hypothetical protein Q7C36_006672 [Tachysurus vachellii]